MGKKNTVVKESGLTYTTGELTCSGIVQHMDSFAFQLYQNAATAAIIWSRDLAKATEPKQLSQSLSVVGHEMHYSMHVSRNAI